MWRCVLAVAGALGLVAVACGGDDSDGGAATVTGSPAAQAQTLAVATSAFPEGGEIPVKYSCDGDNVPFPLSWSGEPGGTQSFVLIFDDPDAPGGSPFVHWVMYDIPADNTGFESVSKDGRLPNGAAQGKNSRGDIGYAGPCPPGGQTHTYVARVYALDVTLGLEPGASRGEVDRALEGHVLASGELKGRFGR